MDSMDSIWLRLTTTFGKGSQIPIFQVRLCLLFQIQMKYWSSDAMKENEEKILFFDI